jgi:predicted anti-sigma-YlaC factor YlaD
MRSLQTIMLSCARAAEYLNLKEEKALSFKQNLQLKAHLLACKTCRAYEKQSETINKMFDTFKGKANVNTENADFKKTLKTKVEKR